MTGFEETSDACGNRDSHPVVVVMASDERFAMPLAVTVRSLLERLDPDRGLRLYLLDAGITPATHDRLRRSWNFRSFDFRVIKPETHQLQNLQISGHVNHVTYYRILMPQLLPEEEERVIYLDSDLLVCRDLGELWDETLADAWALAVPECAAPWMDAKVACERYRDCAPWLAATEPVRNYRELGIAPTAPNLNGGVLSVNLRAWRENDLCERMLACLRQHAEHVLWWDQYALNVVLATQWRALDARWNQGSQIYEYPSWKCSPLSRNQFELLCHDPWIVHFTSSVKPWHPASRHPHRREFFEVLDRTAWKGWRPSALQRYCRLAAGAPYRWLRRIKLATPWARLGMAR